VWLQEGHPSQFLDGSNKLSRPAMRSADAHHNLACDLHHLRGHIDEGPFSPFFACSIEFSRSHRPYANRVTSAAVISACGMLPRMKR